MKDWKTTTLGILTIFAGLINAGIQYFNNHPVDLPMLGASVTAGVGLMHAADATKKS